MPTPFQNYVLRWYAQHGRVSLPWRETQDPYRILVSEVMLQQTQVDRVIPKYLDFLAAFPTVESLATAPLATVLQHWQGLGYNRRALYLQKTAQAIAASEHQAFPRTQFELEKQPGIGPYTAAAICTFAYNQPVVLIETNVRSVFIYHFFPGDDAVHDAQLFPLIAQELWQENPREWYAALMDYGSMLKKLIPNPSRKSRHHTQQSRFSGSLRQVRGEVIRLLTLNGAATESELRAQLAGRPEHLEKALQQLIKEEILRTAGNTYHIA